LNYFDIGITEYYKSIGCPYLGPFKETNSDLFVKKTVVEYLSPLTYDDEFIIGIRTKKIGNSSIVFDSIIHLQKKIICTFEVVVINVSLDTKRPSLLPERLRNCLSKYNGIN
jgi:acyl-CoA thioester hydrolase